MYDLVKGQVQGDELYVEGLDDAFLDWRAQHGEEWARYYGLRVLCPVSLCRPRHACSPHSGMGGPSVELQMWASSVMHPRIPSTRWRNKYIVSAPSRPGLIRAPILYYGVVS